MPEVWLRGPVPDVDPALMPVVHCLLQVREEIERVVPTLSREQVWVRPGGAASIGFHLKHLAGSLDRLLTYARGEALSDAQLMSLAAEERIGSEPPEALLHLALDHIDAALEQIKAVSLATLGAPRRVAWTSACHQSSTSHSTDAMNRRRKIKQC